MSQKQITRSTSNKTQNVGKRTLFDHFTSSQKSSQTSSDGQPTPAILEAQAESSQSGPQSLETIPTSQPQDPVQSSTVGDAIVEDPHIDVESIEQLVAPSPAGLSQTIPPARKNRTRKGNADPSKPVFSIFASAAGSSTSVLTELPAPVDLSNAQPVMPATVIQDTDSSTDDAVVRDPSVDIELLERPLEPPSIDPRTIIPPARKKRTRKGNADPSKPVFSIFAKPSPASISTTTLSTSIEVLDITNDVPSSPISIVESLVDVVDREGTTRHNPIVLGSSPSRPMKALYDEQPPSTRCGRPPKAPKQSLFVSGSLKSAVEKNPLPLWPDRESQHVRGKMTEFVTAQPNFLKRCQKEAELAASPPTAWSFSSVVKEQVPTTFQEALPHKDRASFVSSLPPADLAHPAIRKIINSADLPRSEQEDWTQRWRPTRAAEVLGNSHHAIYLRDWLRTLELQLRARSMPPPSPVKQGSQNGDPTALAKTGTKRKGLSKNLKRPQVIRAVTKPKGRKRRKIDFGDEDDWIVHTDDEDEDAEETTNYDDDDELDVVSYGDPHEEPPPAPESQADSLASDYEETEPLPPVQPEEAGFDFSEYLTNTILLCGPPGSGKTASVYSCAAELDWEIFEVSPGGGKRNGSSIEAMVGDVGKNHIVQLQRRIAKHGTPQETLQTGEVRQSAILLEEVDILFKDDINFWPSVVALVRECRRPVILTCSDASLVPMDELPLQTVLTFQPCPAELASTFLQTMAWAEGYTLDRGHVKKLYTTSNYRLNPFDMPDVPLHPLHSGLPSSDLRKSIHQLQWQCTTSKGKAPMGMGGGGMSTDVPSPMDDYFCRPGGGEPTAASSRLLLAEPATVDSAAASSGSPVGGEFLGRLTCQEIESISFWDSYGIRDPARSAWGMSLNDYGALSDADDVVGRTILKDPSTVNEAHRPVWAQYDQDLAMANAAIALVTRGAAAGSILPPWKLSDTHTDMDTDTERGRRMFVDRATYQSDIVKVLEEVVDISGPLMPRGVVFTEHEAWMRVMVRADDANEKDETLRFHRRRTRNRAVYERVLRLREELLSVVRRTELGAG